MGAHRSGSSQGARRAGAVGLCAVAVGLASPAARAQPQLRFQTELRGDFELIGNVLGQECSTDDGDGAPVPAPIVGTLDCSAAGDLDDSSPDVFWISDPESGSAAASALATPAQARSTAVLALPAGAQLVFARLYWSGSTSAASGMADASVTLQMGPGAPLEVEADDVFRAELGETFQYHSSADVLSVLREAAENSPGDLPITVGGVDTLDLPRLTEPNSDAVAAWWLVSTYQLDGDLPRNIALFDGLDVVSNGDAVSAELTGFSVPESGFEARLGVVAFEGESAFAGDSLSFDGDTLSNPENPADDFFNGTRSRLGAPATRPGDLPQLTGGVRSLSGMDLDVVDVTASLSAGQESATITATSDFETFSLGAFITSISTLQPDFGGSLKRALDLDGGRVAVGDELEYEIVLTNEGSDVAVNVTVTDPLPAGLRYVMGSLSQERSGERTGLSDDSDDDSGEYDEATRTLRVRVDQAPGATDGGAPQSGVAVGETVVIRFRAIVDGTATESLENQAIISAAGRRGAPQTDVVTDGNGAEPGTPATVVEVVACETDADCPTDSPRCDLRGEPACVVCLRDADCTRIEAPSCAPATLTCSCLSESGCPESEPPPAPEAGAPPPTPSEPMDGGPPDVMAPPVGCADGGSEPGCQPPATAANDAANEPFVLQGSGLRCSSSPPRPSPGGMGLPLFALLWAAARRRRKPIPKAPQS